MSLNVSYKNKIGHFTVTQERATGTDKYRIDICHANALCAMIHFNKIADQAQLFCFFLDLKHAKNCIKDDCLSNCDNFVFNAKQCDSEMWKLIRLLADNGKKVTIK